MREPIGAVGDFSIDLYKKQNDMPNKWMSHLAKVWAVQKKKGKT